MELRSLPRFSSVQPFSSGLVKQVEIGEFARQQYRIAGLQPCALVGEFNNHLPHFGFGMDQLPGTKRLDQADAARKARAPWFLEANILGSYASKKFWRQTVECSGREDTFPKKNGAVYRAGGKNIHLRRAKEPRHKGISRACIKLLGRANLH